MANVLKGCRLLEADFSGIEAVLSGYFMRDPAYIRLAKLGVHAGLTSHVLKRPYDPRASDVDLSAYFQEIKATQPILYSRCKVVVHGTSYGLTEYGMIRNFPETFPTLKAAQAITKVFHGMAPLLPKWQGQVRERAYQQNYLGGPGDHPFGYKHWYWAVLGFRPITHQIYQQRIRMHQPVTIIQGKYFALVWGDDSKRAVAFYPQSTAAGVLKEVMLRLFHVEHPSYIGDAFYGRTPLRAPIHDSLLLEVPVRVWDRVLEKVYLEMMRPVPELPLGWIPAAERARLGLGEYLSIGVEAKAGMNWLDMEKLPTPTVQELGVSMDGVYLPAMEEDDEDEVALGTMA